MAILLGVADSPARRITTMTTNTQILASVLRYLSKHPSVGCGVGSDLDCELDLAPGQFARWAKHNAAAVQAATGRTATYAKSSYTRSYAGPFGHNGSNRAGDSPAGLFVAVA